MDTEKVIQDLNRRLSAPLPEFYRRRIIFWYDEDREFLVMQVHFLMNFWQMMNAKPH